MLGPSKFPVIFDWYHKLAAAVVGVSLSRRFLGRLVDMPPLKL